jgi:hypothetical protein
LNEVNRCEARPETAVEKERLITTIATYATEMSQLIVFAFPFMKVIITGLNMIKVAVFVPRKYPEKFVE